MKMIRVEATSNVKAECRECLFQSTTKDGGFPFQMVGDEQQLKKGFFMSSLFVDHSRCN